MIDRVVAAGRPGEVFEPRHTTHGFRYAAGRGSSRTADARRRHGRRRAHGPARAPGGSAAATSRQPLPRHHRLVASGTTRATSRPTARSGSGAGLDRRLAAVRPDRGVPLRRGRLLPQVAARPGRRAARRTAASPTTCPTRCAAAGPGRHLADAPGVVRVGRCIVIVPWELWRAYGDDAVLSELWPSMVAWVDFAATTARTQSPPRAGRGPPRARCRTSRSSGTAGYHWGEWLEPGVDDVTDGVSRPRLGRHRVPAPTRPRWRPASAACSATHDEAAAVRGAGRQRPERVARRVHRTRRLPHSRHAGQPCPRAGLRAWSRGAADADARTDWWS